jgi:manganese/zinc/iron transport system substrate-binding protein
MGDILQKMSKTHRVICLGDAFDTAELLHPDDDEQAHDPHFWFDLSMWAKAANHAKSQLQTFYPSWADDLGANFFAYEQALLATHNWAKQTIATIPQNQRVLITAHDAFGYFGRAYTIEVYGLQGISTASEFGLKDLVDLVDFTIEKKVPAVFVESSVPKKSIEAIIEGCRQKGHNLQLGGQLYSDALGTPNTPEATLIGAFKSNVQAIVEALIQPTP